MHKVFTITTDIVKAWKFYGKRRPLKLLNKKIPKKRKITNTLKNTSEKIQF